MIVAFIRTLLFYVILMISMRLMGKRQLGDVEPTELVITILISEMASVPLQDLNAPILHSIVSIALLVCFEIMTSAISMKSVTLRRFFQGRYSILLADGKINQKEMTKLHITVDELLEELRQNGAMSIDEVRFCILETSGRMSVLLKEDTPPVSIPLSIIVDGKLLRQNLKKAEIAEETVQEFLARKGVGMKEVFWLSFMNGE